MSAYSSCCSVAVIAVRLACSGRASRRCRMRRGIRKAWYFKSVRRWRSRFSLIFSPPILSPQGLFNSRLDAHRQRFDAADEAGIHPLRLADHLDPVEPFQHFLPHDLQLQLGQPHADAAVNAEAEGQVSARPGAIDEECVR